MIQTLLLLHCSQWLDCCCLYLLVNVDTLPCAVPKAHGAWPPEAVAPASQLPPWATYCALHLPYPLALAGNASVLRA